MLRVKKYLILLTFTCSLDMFSLNKEAVLSDLSQSGLDLLEQEKKVKKRNKAKEKKLRPLIECAVKLVESQFDGAPSVYERYEVF